MVNYNNKWASQGLVGEVSNPAALAASPMTLATLLTSPFMTPSGTSFLG